MRIASEIKRRQRNSSSGSGTIRQPEKKKLSYRLHGEKERKNMENYFNTGVLEEMRSRQPQNMERYTLDDFADASTEITIRDNLSINTKIGDLYKDGFMDGVKFIYQLMSKDEPGSIDSVFSNWLRDQGTVSDAAAQEENTDA